MISKSFISLLILALTSSVHAAAIPPPRFARQDYGPAIASPSLPPISERAHAAFHEKRLLRLRKTGAPPQRPKRPSIGIPPPVPKFPAIGISSGLINQPTRVIDTLHTTAPAAASVLPPASTSATDPASASATDPASATATDTVTPTATDPGLATTTDPASTTTSG